jgi:hypothetical protein
LGELVDAAEEAKERSLEAGVDAGAGAIGKIGCNKARLIRQQEEKFLMSIVFNINMKINHFFHIVAFSSIYSLILMSTMFNT